MWFWLGEKACGFAIAGSIIEVPEADLKQDGIMRGKRWSGERKPQGACDERDRRDLQNLRYFLFLEATVRSRHCEENRREGWKEQH